MGCGASSKIVVEQPINKSEQLAVNREIERQMKEEHSKDAKVIQLILLGPSCYRIVQGSYVIAFILRPL